MYEIFVHAPLVPRADTRRFKPYRLQTHSYIVGFLRFMRGKGEGILGYVSYSTCPLHLRT